MPKWSTKDGKANSCVPCKIRVNSLCVLSVAGFRCGEGNVVLHGGKTGKTHGAQNTTTLAARVCNTQTSGTRRNITLPTPLAREGLADSSSTHISKNPNLDCRFQILGFQPPRWLNTGLNSMTSTHPHTHTSSSGRESFPFVLFCLSCL